MPSVSKTQQRLMGQAYQVRKFIDTDGKKGKDPKTIDSEYRDAILDIAKGMKKKSLKDFAKTKHENIPEEVEESETGTLGEEIPTVWSRLKPDSKKSEKRSKLSDLQNLVDYRTFLSNNK
jgi:hypothetical protein